MSMLIKQTPTPKGPDERSGSFSTKRKNNGPTTQSSTVDSRHRKRVKTEPQDDLNASILKIASSSIMRPPPPRAWECLNEQSEMFATMGRIAFEKNNITDSFDYIECALKINPTNKDAQGTLAGIQKRVQEKRVQGASGKVTIDETADIQKKVQEVIEKALRNGDVGIAINLINKVIDTIDEAGIPVVTSINKAMGIIHQAIRQAVC